MPVFDARDILSFPNGDNDTDTIIAGIHFNVTTLKKFGYEFYSNGTLSNGSWCIVTSPPYTPTLLYPNGSFINSTWCYTPVNPIGVRGKIAVGFAVAYGLCLVASLVALRKHGKLYLPAEKRFWPIGRRWQWYWAIFVCAMALISLIAAVDVDRYYIVELPLVLTVFFWFVMQMGTMALVWEAIRHWGSWMERQFIDPNPFALPQAGRRWLFEFWLPLFFYFWLWLNFFLIVPRNWEHIEHQRSPEQTALEAVPAATDGRFKAAAFVLFVCWLTTCVSLRHSIKHYQPRNRGLFNRAIGVVRYTPLRFLLILPLSLSMVAYQALCAWEFQWSPLNLDGEHLPVFLGGYGPSLLVLMVQIAAGAVNPNEDKELIRQRRVRGVEADRELGLVRKPAWWRRINGEWPAGGRVRDRIARNVREIGGGRATGGNIDRAIETRANEAEAAAEAAPRPGEALEMNDMHRTESGTSRPGAASASRPSVAPYGGKSDRRRSERTVQAAAGVLFPNSPGASADRRAELMMDGPPPPYNDRGRGRDARAQLQPPTVERSESRETSVSINAPPQQIRSMLDV